MLNGFDRNGQQVLDQAHFLLQEGFGVGHAPEHAVKTRHGFHSGANLSLGREEILARLLVTELRLVREDRCELSLKLLADVHHKRRPNVVVERGVNNLERTMWGKRRSAGIWPAVLSASRPQIPG